MKDQGKSKSVVLFDGFCNFCSGSVLFIIRRDPLRYFLFAASQSPAGQRLLLEYGIAEIASHSIILISDGKIYMKSDAALKIVRKLRGLWPLFYALIILPRPFRDYFYNLLAGNRYRLYGRRKQCFFPNTGIRERFLEPY